MEYIVTIQKRMQPDEYIAEAEWLFEAGLVAEYVCETLKVSANALTKAAWRRGNTFVYERAITLQGQERICRERSQA